MSSLFSGKKIFLVGFILVLLFAIPLTVYLTQKSQQVTSQASPATTLNFTPGNANINIGDTASFDVMMTPGTNQVSFVKITINYDATKFTVDPSSGFVVNTNAFPGAPLQGPTYNLGSVTVSLSVGTDISQIKTGTTPIKIGTITLKATGNTGGTTTPISMPKDQNQILSIGTGDQANENVLLGQPSAALVTIGPGTSSGTTATTNTNTGLTCKSFVIDRSASGTAPYSVTFTVSGSNSNGTIEKATFTFGDGQTQDLTTSGGIGTNSVNVQMSHTYQNAGTFNATATLTDNKKVVTDPSLCKTTITVAAAAAGSGSGGSGGSSVGAGSAVVVVPTAIPTEIPTVTFTPTPTLPATGPGDTIIGIGTAGIMLSILGALLLAF